MGEEVPRLLFADDGRFLEAFGGEELDDGEAAEGPPEVAVRGPHVGGVVVGQGVGRHAGRAVGEGDVVPGEAFFDGGRGGEDEGGAGAEPEEENRAVLGRQAAEGLVGRCFYEVEVADYGEREGTGR